MLIILTLGFLFIFILLPYFKKISKTGNRNYLFADCIKEIHFNIQIANGIFTQIDKKVEFYQKIEKLIEYLTISVKI